MTASAAYPTPRPQRLGEEILNAVSHGFGALLAVAATVLLIIRAKTYGMVVNVIGVAIFGASMFVLYLISCLYHAIPISKGKAVLQVLDHCSIFLLILGTYVPVCLAVLDGPLGITLLAVNTACAVLGILLNAIDLRRFKKFSLVLYVVMGWMAILALPYLFRELSTWGFAALLLGGLAYTAGIIFYRQKEKPYRHGVWHFFVLAGTVFQFFTVYTNCCY